MERLRRAVSFFAVIFSCLICFCAMATGLSASSSDDTVDFVLLLDCTDSMANSDTSNICEAAAKMFTDLAPSNNARVAVVAFGNTWKPAYTFKSNEMSYMNGVMGNYARTRVCTTYNMVSLGSSEERRSIKQAIHNRMNEKKYTHTNTYIGGGLMTALDILCGSDSKDAAIILMSDGRLSGFDTTEKVEWKRTNRELVYDAIDIAASKGWKIYSVELNDDGKNVPAGAAKQLFRDLSSKTGADSREITESDISQLVSGFIDIFGGFMNADAEVLEEKITNGSCSFDLNVPEVTSETNIVITGGNIDSISVDGKEYSSDTYDDKVYFTKNQDGHYTLLKLFAPESGLKRLVVKGDEGAVIRVQTISTCDLPVGLTFSESSPMIRNTEVRIDLFLANPESGEAVRANSFYGKNKGSLTVMNKTTGKSEDLTTSVSDRGYSAVYNFAEPGEYEITASISSDALRGGEKSYTRSFTVENYKMNTELDGHFAGDTLAVDEIVTVRSYFTGPSGKLSGELYKDGEAELEVIRDGVTVTSGLKMSASEDGYSCDYTLGDIGNYTFKVTSRAGCFAGNPDSLTKESESFVCAGYTISTEWSRSSASSAKDALRDGTSVDKNETVSVIVSLIGGDGKQVRKSGVFDSGKAVMNIVRGGERIDSVVLEADEATGTLRGEWRVRRAGELTASVELSDKFGSSDTVRFNVQNHAPVLIKDVPDVKCHVGETIELTVSDYIRDDDNDTLEFISRIESGEMGQDFAWELSEDGSKLIFSVGGHSSKAKLVFTADDGDDTVSLPISFNVSNRKPEKTANIEIPHFIVNVPGFMFFINYDSEPVSFKLDDYFRDPDGLPLVYTLESKSGMVSLKDGVLEIVPNKIDSEKLKLSVTDSADETLNISFDLTVDDWWSLHLRVFIIFVVCVCALIAALSMFIYKNSNIGSLRITSATKDGVPLELNGLINKKTIKKRSLGIARFIINRVADRDSIQAVCFDKGKIIGHFIIGKTVTIKRCGADKIFLEGNTPVHGKKIKLGRGRSVTLRYDNIQITIYNDN